MPDLRLGIDASRAKTGANAFANALKKTEAQTKRQTRASKQSQKSTQGMANAFNLAKVAVGGLVGALAIRSFIRFSDAATNIENRLKLVTKSSDELAVAQAQVFKQAQEARIAFEGQAELFQRVARSSQTLNKTLGETLEVTEAVAKAITISGVSADSANAAIVQLGQGLASGALRGDELRSVLEQTPRLAQAIAEGMGIAVGQLRELGMAGELTAEAVFEALQKQLPQLQAEFAQLTPTFSQAGTVLENSFIRATGAINDATGASESFARLLISSAEIIDEAIVPALIDAGNVGRIVFTQIIGAIDRFLLRLELVAVGAEVALARARDESSLFDDIFSGLAGAARDFNSELDQSWRITQIGLSPLRIISGLLAENEDGTEDINVVLREQNRIIKEITQSEETVARITQEAVERRIALMKKLNAEVGAGGEGGAGGEDPGIQATKDQISELAKIIEQSRSPLQIFQEQLEKLQVLKTVADNTEGVTFTTDQFNASIQQAVNTFAAADPAIEAFNDELKRMQDIVEGLMAPQEIFNQQISDYAKLLQAGRISQDQFNQAIKEAADTLIESDPVLARQNQLRLDAVEVINSLKTAEQLLAEEEARLNVLIRETGLTADEARQALKNFEDGLDQTRNASEQFAIQAARNIQSAFADFLFDPFEDGLKGMFQSFASTLKKIAAEILANALLKQALQLLASFGGPIGQFATIAQGAISQKQSGGPVSRGSPTIVGERGPELFTPRQSGQISSNAATMAGLMPTINNTVIVDPRAFSIGLSTPAGGRDLINAISVNKRAIQAALQ